MRNRSLSWPKDEVQSFHRGGKYRKASAICERGHQIDRSLSPMNITVVPDMCSECGGKVLTACELCEVRIPGAVSGGDIFWEFIPSDLPYFCDNCGSMYPWATKRERIYELENRLRNEAIDEVDYKAISDQLQKLLNDDLSSEEEKKIWERVKSKAGVFFFSENVKDIATSLMTKVLRDQLGI